MATLEAQAQSLTAELEARRRADVQAKAASDATDTRVQEAQVIRVQRGATQALAVSLTQMGKGMVKLSQRMQKSLEAMANDSTPLTLPEMERVSRLLSTMATAGRQIGDTSRQVMEMERMWLGEPTSHTAVTHTLEVSFDEAERRLAAGQRAIERAKAKGLLVDGEIVDPDIGLPAGTLGKGPGASPGHEGPSGGAQGRSSVSSLPSGASMSLDTAAPSINLKP